MFKFWEYQISFKDPAAVYSYHLIGVHHSVIWYLIIILILVYYWLLMIVRDFNWDNFNRSQGISSWLVILYSVHSSLSQVSVFKQIQKDFVDIKFLFWLGAESHLFGNFFGDLFLKAQNWFTGSQALSFNKFDDSLIDITGKVFFDDEIFLFDYETHLLRDSMIKCVIESKDLDSNIISPWFNSDFQEPLFHTLADPAAINWYYNERLVSFSLYHYTANAFFFLMVMLIKNILDYVKFLILIIILI